jgi:restriction system protein
MAVVAVTAAWSLFRLLGLDARSRERRRLFGLSLAELDRLEGSEFEAWVEAQLTAADFAVTRTRPGHDYGVDLIAERAGVRIGIEAKRWQGTVPNAVVRSLIGGCEFHDCTAGAIITTSRFSRHAGEQARQSRLPIALLGRSDLGRLGPALQALSEPGLADECG